MSYLVRHKFFVFLAGLRTKVPLFRLLIHDWSKFLPSEWFPYARYFYGDRSYYKWAEHGKYIPGFPGRGLSQVEDEFNVAWLKHIHRNKHHWQYWNLVEDSPTNPQGRPRVIEMPEKYVREMVADWLGAGRAQQGKWDIGEWYEKNKEHIAIGPFTRKRAEALIQQFAKNRH